MQTEAIQAIIRFGLGQRGTQPPPADPTAWLSGQITGPDTAVFPRDLPSVSDGLIVLREQNKFNLPRSESLVRPLYELDVDAQTRQLLTTDAPFRERLVWFWANHFTVSIRQGGTAAVVGPYLREAIRPNVTSPFFGMLLSVIRHPAMLMYLENDGSVGPNSPIGLQTGRGLNENLARECLELHTLSPASGYTQQDVTEFAKILTGWSIDRKAAEPGFVFREAAHEPGSKTVMGRTFPPGEAGGIMALDFLANHPATHHHLAIQLASQFLADAPPPDAVTTIEGVLRDTQGDLGAAALAVTKLPGAWTPLTKFRTPQDFAVAALRLLDLPDDRHGDLRAANVQTSDWASPDGMMRRIDWSYGFAGHVGRQDPVQLAEAALGPFLNTETATEVQRAGSRRDALTLLFASPEFQRR
jgi:uncharacterized protein (DUF1800 family)